MTIRTLIGSMALTATLGLAGSATAAMLEAGSTSAGAYDLSVEMNSGATDGAPAGIAGYVDRYHWGRAGAGDGRTTAPVTPAFSGLTDAVSADRDVWPAGRSAGAAPDLIYFTPRIAGLGVGVLLSPDASGDDDPVRFGINYTAGFGDVGIELAGTYGTGKPSGDAALWLPTTARTLHAWGAAARLSYDAFDIDAAYGDVAGTETRRAAAGTDAGRHFSTSLGYGTGGWNLKIGYQRSEKGSGAGGGADTVTDRYLLGASYQLAPGWQVLSEVDHYAVGRRDAATTPVHDDGVTIFVLTNRFNF